MKRIIPLIAVIAALFAMAKDLALPPVPADLRVPALRADYIAAHFWDSADWADTMVTDPMQVAQNVANFLSVFPVMSGDSARVAAIDTFVTRALAAGDNPALAASQAIEDCLFGHESPQRDERLYTLFLERMLAAGYPDSMRLEYMLEMTVKNMPGTPAADFAFVTRDGRRTSLREFVDRPTVLFFYDPDCHICHSIGLALADDPVIKAKLIGGRLRMLAVSPGEAEPWQEHAPWLPASWTDANDGGVIDESELYNIGNYPTIYLLDARGNVILKDCTAKDLVETIARNGY